MATVQNQGNSVNEAHKAYRQSRTTFPLTYLHYTTEAYGLINPFFGMEGVEGDTIPLNSEEDLRTHTLQSPLMSKVSKNKDYYVVPMRAILPKTWEQIYANPTQGDDIPEDANCTFPISELILFFSRFFTRSYENVTISSSFLTFVIKAVLTMESFFSNGSLLSKFGIHLASLFSYVDDEGNLRSFDYWFDSVFFPWFKNTITTVTFGTFRYSTVLSQVDASGYSLITPDALLDKMRDDFFFSVVSDGSEGIDFLTSSASRVSFYTVADVSDADGESVKGYINISRLLAYQLVCFHFYTDDKIDSIYSAALYRGLMQSMAGDIASTSGSGNASNINSIRKYFTYNGELLEYDLFSEAVFNGILFASGISSYLNIGLNSSTLTVYSALLAWLRNIFGFNRSLRFGDYFTGSRPSPLAVGDVNTPVVSSEVNTVDMTKSLLMQRFLNSVNRVGRKFSNYVQMLAGTLPAPNPTDPKFLAHSVNDLGSFEVENTAENQGNIVTLMRDGSSRFAFTYDVNEPCIVIGVSWYEVARIYSKTIDRHAFHRTRFDMFNKFFQYSGDQAIYKKELDCRWLSNPSGNFAYTLRYMEYKQRPSIASGGFVEFLPGYSFITDNEESGDLNALPSIISPDYIRARPVEFDRFYSSLTGHSLGSRFHFIVRYINQCPAEREMEYAPSVL